MTTKEKGDQTPGPAGGGWLFLLGVALVGGVLFFYRLGAPGLMDPDEGRYAEIAREFFVLGDWGIPHLNLLPYLEKPPLVYWLTALSFKVCGFTELAARLPSAVSALGGVFLAYGLGRALWGPGPGMLKEIVVPGLLFANVMQLRSVPAPESAVLVTDGQESNIQCGTASASSLPPLLVEP